MTASGAITARNVDLSNCDREQIQFPGAILPHGALLVLLEPELEIIQASQNTAEILGFDASDLIHQRLSKLLGTQVESIRDRLMREVMEGFPTRVTIASIRGRQFDVLAHRNDRVLFLEFEPRSNEQISVSDLYSELRATTARLQTTQSVQEFLDSAVTQIRAFTGFDRVMAYKFLSDGSGWVRSESVVDGYEPYLGLHYPASDVPAPAKRLFSLSWLRHQPDIGYTPVPMIPENNPVTGGPLDMSYALLRSVSVMYTGYLKNMGTKSSMVMTLMKDGQLWGLIACHHHSNPKHVPYEIRLACEFLANMVSLLISEKEDREHSEYRLKLKTAQDKFVQSMARTGEFADSLTAKETNLLDFVHAQGAAVAADGRIITLGNTPSERQIQFLLEWLSAKGTRDVFATDSLVSHLPEAIAFKDVASGILALRLAATKNDYLLWFRPEVIHTVKWAGDPHKPVDIADGGERLLPRTSFALWKETVRFKSEPWFDFELQAARDLRVATLELIIERAEKVRDLYDKLEKSYIELDAFAYVASHDLKEPLRGIHNYSRFLLEDCSKQLRQEDIAKLQSTVRLSQRMESLLDSLLQYSRMSRKEMTPRPCDVHGVVEEVLDSLSARLRESGATIRIPRRLPEITADPITLSEIFSNLISNALKYNEKPEKWVEIGYTETPEEPTVFYVRDNGIGIEPEHLDSIFVIFRRLHGPKEYGGGTGAGLTIARKLAERHGGRMWVESLVDQGSTFYFTL